MKQNFMRISRRSFIKSASVASVPFILPSHIWAAETKPGAKLTMGFIGMGKQSRGLLGSFLSAETRVLAVCDVDTTRRENAKKRVDDYYEKKGGAADGGCAAYNDFRELISRKDIDAVCIATPDHWHAVITLAALRAGKDVYCEKPLTHNIHEAVQVMRAVDANKRVLQTGSMQRSSKEFRVACELVRNGAIGKVPPVIDRPPVMTCVTSGLPGLRMRKPSNGFPPAVTPSWSTSTFFVVSNVTSPSAPVNVACCAVVPRRMRTCLGIVFSFQVRVIQSSKAVAAVRSPQSSETV